MSDHMPGGFGFPKGVEPKLARGHASGCSWWAVRGGFQWSAYGPNGGTTGTADTEAEAQRRAEAAERSLRVRVGGDFV